MKKLGSKLSLALVLALGHFAFSAPSLYAQPVVASDPPTAQVPPVPPSPPSEPSPPPSAPEAPVAPPAPVIPNIVRLNEIAAPAEGMGQVVFFRPSRMTGMAVSFSVREGDTGIGKLTNGTYFVHASEPGTKEYNIASEARDTLRMEIEAGETYYVIQSISLGLLIARPNLTPSSETAFQEKRLNVSRARATSRNAN